MNHLSARKSQLLDHSAEYLDQKKLLGSFKTQKQEAMRERQEMKATLARTTDRVTRFGLKAKILGQSKSIARCTDWLKKTKSQLHVLNEKQDQDQKRMRVLLKEIDAGHQAILAESNASKLGLGAQAAGESQTALQQAAVNAQEARKDLVDEASQLAKAKQVSLDTQQKATTRIIDAIKKSKIIASVIKWANVVIEPIVLVAAAQLKPVWQAVTHAALQIVQNLTKARADIFFANKERVASQDIDHARLQEKRLTKLAVDNEAQQRRQMKTQKQDSEVLENAARH